MKRTQIYLEEIQDQALAERARRSRCTKSTLIRRAIDRYLEDPEDDELAAIEALKAAVHEIAKHPLTYLPDGLTYVQNLRKGEEARQRELDHRWQQ